MGTTTLQQKIGRKAEDRALLYLQKAGLELVERNYRCRWGEVDLILHDQQTLVFVEVRYRRSARFGSAAESVDPQKQRKVVQTAESFLQRNPHWARQPARFDIVALEEPNRVEWIQNAFGN